MLLKTKEHYFFFFVLVFLFSTDILVYFNIPIFQQIFGFILLTFIPGLLILQMLKLYKLNFLQIFVFSEGISIAFLLFLGLIINIIYPIFGLNSPLSLASILITFNFCIILFLIVLNLIRKDDVIAIYDIKSLKILQLNSSEKRTDSICFINIFNGSIGNFLNYHQNNNFILVFFILIAVALLLIYLLAEKIDKRIFPFLLYTISISLLLIFLAPRSNYFIGFDTHEEFHFFISALNNLKWKPQPGYLLSSADLYIDPLLQFIFRY